MLREELNQFIGCMDWTRYGQTSQVIFSEGVAYLAKKAKAYWLIDAIASHIIHNRDYQQACRRDPGFDYLHFWTLTVTGTAATLVCVADLGKKPVVRQDIPFTDFPLDEITIYCGNDGPRTPRKLFLPSEY